MSSINTALDIASNTLQTQQALMNISSNNISNADNAWYAEESGTVTANPEARTMGGYVGTGASLQQVTETRDNSVEQQLLNANGQASQYTTLSTQLGQVSAYMQDDGTNGISSLLGNFWSSWDQLSQDSGSSNQANVYAGAQNLAQGVNTLNANLSGQASSIISQVGQTVTAANKLLNQISQYNNEIVNQQTVNATPNALYDQRYQAVQSLSQLIGINYQVQSNGAMNITLPGSSIPLISNSSSIQPIEMQQINSATGAFTLSIGKTQLAAYTNNAGDPTGSPQVQMSTNVSGQLQGLMQSLGDVSNYSSQLDTFKDTLINQVNAAYNLNTTAIQSAQSANIPVADTNTNTGDANTTFTINGQTAFTVPPGGMTLTQMAAAINGLDTGATPTGVNAKIVQTSTSNYSLVLANDKTGTQPINLSDSTFTNGGKAVFAVDGGGNATNLSTSAQNVFSNTPPNYIGIDPSFTASSVNATQAMNVSSLQDTNIPALGNGQFSGYLSAMQEQLGADGQNATTQTSFATALQQQVQTQQQSVSGVSIDQEMMNILKYQQVYQAAAKVVSTTQTMINTLTSMVQ